MNLTLLVKHGYREILRTHFARRVSRNSRYSLRSFARDLSIQPSRLNEIMKGTRGLSRAAAEGIAVRLGLTPSERSLFCDLVESQHARNATLKKQAQERLRVVQAQPSETLLSLDELQAITDLNAWVLLEYLRIRPDTADSDRMARDLSLSPAVVQSVLERLQRLKVIEVEDGKVRVVGDILRTPDQVPSAALRDLHDQVIARASDALHFKSIEERDFYSFIMPISGRKIPLMRKRIRDFVAELNADFGNDSEADRIVNLSSHLFDLVKIEANPGSSL